LGLREYTIRRVLTGLVTLFVILIFNWVIFRLPSFVTGIDPVWFYVIQQIQAGQQDPRRFITLLIRYKQQWKLPGLHAPLGLWIDHIITYLKNMFTFNFGRTTKVEQNALIAPLLARRIVVSVFLLLPATLISIAIGIMLGVKLGANPGSRLDVIMMSLALMLYSIPTFWLQVLLKGLLAGEIQIWPSIGGLASLAQIGAQASDPLISFIDAFYMISLPVLTLVLASFAGWMILMRGSLMDVMGEDFILTAKAKGLDEATILYKHAFRNAILPVVTGVVLAIAGVWTGAVITETIFSIPGVGRLLLSAILNLDYPLCETTFYFIALTTIFANIIADISYALLDPRVRY